MTAINQPKLQMSTDKDANTASRENKWFEMKYKAAYNKFVKRKRVYNIGLMPCHEGNVPS